jgi:hypothetical protein
MKKPGRVSGLWVLGAVVLGKRGGGGLFLFSAPVGVGVADVYK